jgi:hypothetical protein
VARLGIRVAEGVDVLRHAKQNEQHFPL